ncbi:hypothetical protein ACFLTI_03535 [Bacteroidota bacterium]
MRYLIRIILLVVIAGLAYLIVNGIQKPIDFEKEYKVRKEVVVNRLKDIRKAQIAYKSVNKEFTADWNVLQDFIKHDSFPIVKITGNMDELEEKFGLTEAQALRQGRLIRDTAYVNVLDSVFHRNYYVDSLCIIPYSNNKLFELGAREIETSSKVKVWVFEASALNFDFLTGMDRQLIINMNDKSNYPGLKVGSLDEVNNNAGNWEK